MFTGIIEATGTIERVERTAANTHLVISGATLGMGDVAVGDSIAVDGVCLTVVAKDGASFHADVSGETLACTAGFEPGSEVNLEKSLRFGDRVGGHMMSGHVDGAARVVAMENLGASWRLELAAPIELGRYIARKGSVAVNGVSLTVNRVENSRDSSRFEINLIPHTYSATALRNLNTGCVVNLEVDLMARYIERMLSPATE
jgi:riboflavin synthase